MTLDNERGQWTSASSAEADHLCPGRHRAQLNLPELPKTPESTTGERVHAIWCGPGVLDATPEELDAADSLCDLERELSEQFFGGPAAAMETMRFVEKRLWHEFRPKHSGFHYANGPVKTSGRFDVVRFRAASGRALLIDGKTGYLDVAPNPSNLQLRRLAALLYLEVRPTQIGVAIIRPHSKPSEICVYEESDLEQAGAEMERDVAASHDPTAKRIPGEEQCRYCRARDLCPERLEWVRPVIQALALPNGQLPAATAKEWTPEQRSLFLEREQAARKWLEDRKDEIKALLCADPGAAPGYCLKPGRVTETVVNPQEVFNRFVVIQGKTEQFLPCVNLVKGRFKDAVRVVTGHKGKQLEQDVDALLDGCTEAKEAAPTIAKL